MLVYDRSRLVTDAEEGMDASYHIPTIKPERTNMTYSLSRGEGYNGILNCTITPTFDNSNEYKTRTKTIDKQKMHQTVLHIYRRTVIKRRLKMLMKSLKHRTRKPTNIDPIYANDGKFFNKETSADKLERKFPRFTKITKPRQTLNYFIGEFERLNVTDDHTK